MKYRVAEIFTSINGEGAYAGKMAVFIRLVYCNLACSYCDTSWANGSESDFTEMTREEILENIRQSGARHVTLTGGEPLLNPNAIQLLDFLSKEKDLFIEVETNGSINLQKAKDLARKNITFTMDYKLPDSAMESYMDKANLKILGSSDVLKFVVSSKRDLERALDLIKSYGLDQSTKVYFSPSYRDIDAKDIVDFILKNRLDKVRLQLQLHKYIWDPDQRGV